MQYPERPRPKPIPGAEMNDKKRQYRRTRILMRNCESGVVSGDGIVKINHKMRQVISDERTFAAKYISIKKSTSIQVMSAADRGSKWSFLP